ncbi:MAG: hypothetical protein HYT65_03470 [Candidatus Yanofskybacteria bacterium]|nr:hypothetical protein [Candidatus Yanofskybacteria bacterium]
MSEDIKNKIKETVEDLLNRVGFEGEVKLSENAPAAVINEPGNDDKKSFLTVSIESANDLSMLIGKNGQNLSAFDHIARLLVNKKLNGYDGKFPINFMVDINDYRKSKTNYLIDVARNTAKRVTQTQKAEALPPMSSYERRLVHTELASFKEIQTESIGQEPRRRVVIKPQVEQL